MNFSEFCWVSSTTAYKKASVQSLMPDLWLSHSLSIVIASYENATFPFLNSSNSILSVNVVSRNEKVHLSGRDLGHTEIMWWFKI